MRYDTPVYFQHITPGAYNPETGDYAPDTVKEVKRYASVTDSGDETKLQLYGSIKEKSVTIRLQNHYKVPFDRVRVGDTVYRVDKERKLRTKHTFIASEVQQNG